MENTVFQLEEKEYVGEIPKREDITVLPADEPKKKRLGWVILNGHELYTLSTYALKKLKKKEILNYKLLPRYKNKKLRFHKTIKDINDLRAGDKVLYYYGNGEYRWEIVQQTRIGQLYIKSGGWYHSLTFTDDYRDCWTTDGVSNIRPS